MEIPTLLRPLPRKGPFVPRASVRVDKRLANNLGNLDGNKAVLRVKIILTALVNDADVSVDFCFSIWKRSINLVQFEGGRVVRVVHANNKMQ